MHTTHSIVTFVAFAKFNGASAKAFVFKFSFPRNRHSKFCEWNEGINGMYLD